MGSSDPVHEYGIGSLEKYATSINELAKRISALEGGGVENVDSPLGKNSDKGTPNRSKTLEEQGAAIKGLGIRTKVLMARLDSFEERLSGNSNARVPSKVVTENKHHSFSNSKTKNAHTTTPNSNKNKNDEIEIVIDDDNDEEEKNKSLPDKATKENLSIQTQPKSNAPPVSVSESEQRKPVKISLMSMKKKTPNASNAQASTASDTESTITNVPGGIRLKGIDKLVGANKIDKANNNADSDSDASTSDRRSERPDSSAPPIKKYQKFFTSKSGGPRHTFFKQLQKDFNLTTKRQ